MAVLGTQRVRDLAEMFGHGTFVDLSPILENGMPRWPTHAPVIVHQSATHDRDGYFLQTLLVTEHSGAHVDAPAHMHPELGAETVDVLPLGQLIRPALTLHLESRQWSPGEKAEAKDLVEAERQVGDQAASGDVVLLCFGWNRRYWHVDKRWRFYAENSPGLAESAVRFLIDRGVAAVGSDTIACGTSLVDGLPDPTAPGLSHCWMHDVALRRGILLLENLCNLESLPARSLLIALPLRIRAGSGSPIRPIAFVPSG